MLEMIFLCSMYMSEVSALLRNNQKASSKYSFPDNTNKAVGPFMFCSLDSPLCLLFSLYGESTQVTTALQVQQSRVQSERQYMDSQ